MIKKIKFLFTLALIVVLNACSVSFSLTDGGPNYEQIQSMSILNFYSKVASGPADLSLRFTEELKEFMQQRTKLEIVNTKADTQLDGFISYYGIKSQGATTTTTGEEFAAQNILIIKIKVKYTNFKNPNESFEHEFTSPQDLTYDQSESLSDVEDDLILDAFNQIEQDIYNKCFSNW